MNSETEAVADLARRASTPQVVLVGDRKFLVVPEGFEEREVTNESGLPIERPPHIKQRVTIQERDSLIEYINRYKRPETLLFGDITANRIVAQIDYHEAADGTEEQGKAHYVAHAAVLTLQHSEEWKTWSGIDTKLMGQLEFARFVEENAPDIAAPTAGDLLDTVRDLQAHRRVNFVQAVRTASDNENFEYTDETEARSKSGIEIPSQFTLNIPVYFGEGNVQLFAYLRWRLEEGKLFLGVKLSRAEYVRQAAFKLIVTDIVGRTGCRHVYGAI